MDKKKFNLVYKELPETSVKRELKSPPVHDSAVEITIELLNNICAISCSTFAFLLNRLNITLTIYCINMCLSIENTNKFSEYTFAFFKEICYTEYSD